MDTSYSPLAHDSLIGEMFETATSKDLEELADSLRMIEKSVGWQYLTKVLKDQAHQRVTRYLVTPLKTRDQILEQEYIKGEVAALLLFSEFVPNLRDIIEATYGLKKATDDAELPADEDPAEEH